MAELTRIVGPQTIIGTAAEIDALGDVPDRVASIYGARVQPYQVRFRDQADMPIVNTLGDRAKGVWRGAARRVIMSRAFGTYWVPDVYGHEGTHVLDDDWLGRPQRTAVMELMLPMPSWWNDLTIDPNEPPLYVNSPAEAFASYGAAAMLGVRPVYTTLYRRRIAPEKWTRLRDIVLPGTDPCDPDQMAQLKRELTEALANLTASHGRIVALEDGLRVGAVQLDGYVDRLESVDLTIRDMTALAGRMRDTAGPGTE